MSDRMLDREMVIKGLAACMPQTEEDAAIGCNACPYNGHPCGGDYQDNDHVNLPVAMIEDVRALLKAQEPRVMTLEEMLNAEKRAEPLWCEFIDCALGSWRMGWKLRTAGKREVQHILENLIERAIVWESEYERGWRCWTSRPTDAQREAEPWEP